MIFIQKLILMQVKGAGCARQNPRGLFGPAALASHGEKEEHGEGHGEGKNGGKPPVFGGFSPGYFLFNSGVTYSLRLCLSKRTYF